MNLIAVRALFAVAGAYDFLIGLAFLGSGPQIFEAASVPQPNHWGYIQFAALLLITFGCLFFTVATRPRENRNLIPYGVLLKASYVGIVSYYWATSGVPALFKPFAVIDALMLILFVAAWRSLGKRSAGPGGPT
jgi:hypothetical protein